MLSFTRRCLSVLVLLLWASSAYATDYYFAAAGSDGGACTFGSPCKTLAKLQTLLGSAAPGDTFNLNQGDTFAGGVTIPAHTNGSSAFPILIQPYGSGAAPIIDATGVNACFYARTTGGGGTAVYSYITINGFECKNATQYGVLFYQNAGGTRGMPGIIVENMNIHNTGPSTDDGNYRNQLMFLDENDKADGVQFLGNTVTSCGGHNCIQIQKDAGSPIVSGNFCQGWHHNCIDLKSVIGGQVTSNKVNGAGSTSGACYYNENAQTTADDVTFKFNQCYNAPNGFECEIGGNFPANSTTCHIWNNTISLGTQSAIVTGGDSVCGNVTLDVRNDILDTTSIYFDGHSCTTPTWDYNDDGATHVPPLTPRGAHDIVHQNPLWISPTSNYQIAWNSPCANAGSPGLTTNPNMGSELIAPTATSTPTPTVTPTATPTATGSGTPTATATPTVTATPTRTATRTPTSTPTPVNGPAANTVNMGRGPNVIPGYFNVPQCSAGQALSYTAPYTFTCVSTGSAGSGFVPVVKTIADSPFSVPNTDPFYSLSASSSAGADFVANLPAATGSGNAIIVKRLDATAHSVEVVPNGADTIDGVNATTFLSRQYVALEFIDYAAGAWALW